MLPHLRLHDKKDQRRIGYNEFQAAKAIALLHPMSLSPSTMVKPLCNLHAPLLSSFHHKQPLILLTPQKLHHFTSATRTSTKPRLSLSPHYSNSRRFRFSPPKSTSINGYAAEEYKNDPRETEVELLERLRRLFAFLRSILPGGTWWSFSDEAQIRIFAKPVTVVRALTRMWGLVSRDRWVIFAAFSALIVAALSEISIPHYLTASIFTAQSGEVAVFRQNVRLLLLLCVVSGICSGIRGCCFGIANMLLVKRMRETLYSSLLLQDIFFFDTETVGDLTSRLGADCQQVSRVIGNDLNMILRNVLQGTGAMIYLLILSWPLGLCILVICSTLAAIMLIYGRYQKKAAKLTQEFTASANEVAQETFSLVRTVRVYGTEKQELGRYKLWLGKLADISLRQSAAYGHCCAGRRNVYSCWSYYSRETYKVYIVQRVANLFNMVGGDNLSSLMQSVGASEKVFQLMDLLPSSRLQRLVGHVEFVNVSFHYATRPTVPVLQSISLSVKPNEVVAIVGLSGSGKSTLVNLLLRLYEPTNGQILIDGFPLQELDVKWWRERIGFVGQEPKLFRMDISSNISYGCTRDIITQEDVEWAAKQAYAHDFILALPNGYHTLVDDDLLSGGQKQRIAIARAILRDPTILILDEATSALDAESEHNVKGVLRAVRSDKTTRRTVMVIAHRLSTIQAADRIVVMDAGRIVETGSHRDLLVDDGLYARLTRRQADAVA
ncbi:transporter associated with antigen processing protein 1 [Prunus dulcis]|uniref:Transporter associated with antigen processing protein 1 n=1 Tax=Prunus dulcis TaxID=3755 RepID=A0A4Y1QQ77_PRUDU|nr:transporter associated with antigen processing protein 1 [Prunus dulcis]